MPRIDLVAKLLRAVGQRDLVSAEKIASEIAAHEERKGHHTAAQLLRGSLVGNGVNGGYIVRSHQAEFTQSVLGSALALRSSAERLSEIVLRPDARRLLDEIIREAKHAKVLASRGIRRRTKLLFHGPPGCGKSLTALCLANELNLPLYVVRFDSVIGSYLGQTAVHLRELFEFAHRTNCVLLFDEIDALGKRRGHPSDVGELDRIVIALMQELELSDNRGLVVATSNLPEALDLALWRRFDLSLSFPRPTASELRSFLRSRLRAYRIPSEPRLLRQVVESRSFAEAERLIEDAARRQVLFGE